MDDDDEGSGKWNAAQMEDLRDEFSSRIRDALGLPAPSKHGDMEVDMVLTYLAHCGDYYELDPHLSKGGPYNPDTALWDLDLLVEAVEKVRKMLKVAKIKKAKREGRTTPIMVRVKDASTTSGVVACPIGPIKVLTAEDFERVEGEIDPEFAHILAAHLDAAKLREKMQEGKKATAMTIGRTKK